MELGVLNLNKLNESISLANKERKLNTPIFTITGTDPSTDNEKQALKQKELEILEKSPDHGKLDLELNRKDRSFSTILSRFFGPSEARQKAEIIEETRVKNAQKEAMRNRPITGFIY
jgi:hypothetical protein